MKNLYVNTEDVKEQVLDAMYHLGLIYIDKDEFNNYAKAAGIFQYCAGFAKKYDVAIEINKAGETILADSEYFLSQAHEVEREFLKNIKMDLSEFY